MTKSSYDSKTETLYLSDDDEGIFLQIKSDVKFLSDTDQVECIMDILQTYAEGGWIGKHFFMHTAWEYDGRGYGTVYFTIHGKNFHIDF